jgi:serine/threonine protein kinase
MKFLRDVKHDNVVTCYGILSEGGTNMMVMELCATPLHLFLRDEKFWRLDRETERPLTQWDIDGQKCKVLHDVVAGLEYLHDNNLMHRDVKASNIVQDRAFKHWKICDFGESKVLKGGRAVEHDASDDHITMAYAAPEFFGAEDGGEGGIGARRWPALGEAV